MIVLIVLVLLIVLPIIISKKVRFGLINFLFLILNGIVLILQFRTFPYLFGHCKHCSLETPEGVDFSRTENALGTSFDANDVLRVSALILFIIALICTYKLSNKWIESVKRRRVYKIIMTIIFLFIYLAMHLATWG